MGAARGLPLSSRRRLDLLAPPDHVDQRAEVDRLVSLGATRVDIGQGRGDWVVMADPDVQVVEHTVKDMPGAGTESKSIAASY